MFLVLFLGSAGLCCLGLQLQVTRLRFQRLPMKTISVERLPPSSIKTADPSTLIAPLGRLARRTISRDVLVPLLLDRPPLQRWPLKGGCLLAKHADSPGSFVLCLVHQLRTEREPYSPARWNERQSDAERISFDSQDSGSEKGKGRELDPTAFHIDFGDFGPDGSIDPLLRSLQSSEEPLPSMDDSHSSPGSRDIKRSKVKKSQKRGGRDRTPPLPSPTASEVERTAAELEADKGLKSKKKRNAVKMPRATRQLKQRVEPSPHNMYRQNRSGAGQRIPWTEAEDRLFREELERIYESGGSDQKARPWAAIMKVCDRRRRVFELSPLTIGLVAVASVTVRTEKSARY
jgi:hypothetical protein